MAKKGVPLSKEHREKISKAKLGVPRTEEVKRKISETSKGRTFGEEHRRNIQKIKDSDLKDILALRDKKVTYQEIANMYNVTLNTVFVRVREAKQKLKGET